MFTGRPRTQSSDSPLNTTQQTSAQQQKPQILERKVEIKLGECVTATVGSPPRFEGGFARFSLLSPRGSTTSSRSTTSNNSSSTNTTLTPRHVDRSNSIMSDPGVQTSSASFEGSNARLSMTKN